MLTPGHPPETRTRVSKSGHPPGTQKHDVVEEGLQALSVQQKMESVEELRRALEAAQAGTAALRAAAEGADRAPRVNDTGDADEADMLGQQLMGVLNPTQDKMRTQHFLGGGR